MATFEELRRESARTGIGFHYGGLYYMTQRESDERHMKVLKDEIEYYPVIPGPFNTGEVIGPNHKVCAAKIIEEAAMLKLNLNININGSNTVIRFTDDLSIIIPTVHYRYWKEIIDKKLPLKEAI